MTGKLTNKTLARKIRARKRFLDNVLNPIIQLVDKRGTVTKREQRSSYTHVVAELRNFGNFTFRTDLDKTKFGGDTIKVWYHPGRSFREGGLDSVWDKEWIPVLDINFLICTDYLVREFNKKTDWQRALVSVLKNQDNVATQINKIQEKAVERLQTWRQEGERNDQLIREAKKLGIVPR